MAEIVVAFDVPSGREALALAGRLPGLTWAKLGHALYAREGPALVREFAARGLRVFLDLKWHDIPNTVAGAVSAARELGVSLATVHCLGGRAMLAAAARAAGPDLPIVGVTAHALESDRDMCLASGMDDYMSKPISPELLEAKAQRWLGTAADEAGRSIS